MIRINDDWIIDIDRYNYTLRRDMHTTRIIKKNGEEIEEPVYNTVGHYSSLNKALDNLGKEIIRYKLIDGEYTLKTAVNAIRECQDEWRRLTDEIKNERE